MFSIWLQCGAFSFRGELSIFVVGFVQIPQVVLKTWEVLTHATFNPCTPVFCGFTAVCVVALHVCYSVVIIVLHTVLLFLVDSFLYVSAIIYTLYVK